MTPYDPSVNPASPKQPRASADNVTLAELRLAARNHALPLEAPAAVAAHLAVP